MASSDWANIPAHILDVICHKLIVTSEKTDSSVDYHRFGAICKAWRQVAHHNFKKHPRLINIRRPHLLPSLLLPGTSKDGGRLQNVVTTNPYDAVISVRVPYTMSSCVGSSHGWLVFAANAAESEDRFLFLTLYNPFTEKTIDLPPIDHLHPSQVLRRYRTYANKVILSSDPTTNPNFIAVVLFSIKRGGSTLAMFRSGDDTPAWLMDFVPPAACVHEYEDVLFHRGKLYLTDQFHRILWFDYSSSSVTPLHVEDHHVNESAENLYLVESTDGCFYKVVRLRSGKRFEVHKLIHHDDGGGTINDNEGGGRGRVVARWKRVDDIRGDTIFLGGSSHSMAVKASDHPGCLPDSIYFIPDPGYYYDGYDVWIFQLKGRYGFYGLNPCFDIVFESNKRLPAIWIETSPINSTSHAARSQLP